MSEFSFEEAQNYESLVATYAPFPGAQLVEVAVLSEDPNDPKVGIYRANNGSENGEDLIVMLPHDFPEEPAQLGLDINDFDPRRSDYRPDSSTPIRDVIYDALLLERGDSAIEQYKTGFSEIGQVISDKLPSISKIIRSKSNLDNEVELDQSNDRNDVSRLRKVAAATLIGLTLTSSVALPAEQRPGLNQEQITNDPNVALPQDIKIVYTVPKTTPRVLDLATALDMDAKDIADQIEEQVGSLLGVTDTLPAEARLRITARGTAYTPKQNETLSSLSARFNVPPNVLIAANVKLADIPADQVIKGISSVSIPRPVTIVSLPEGSTVEDATKNAHIAELIDSNPTLLTAIDPGFDGNSVVIPEGLGKEELDEIVATTLPPETSVPKTPEASADIVSPEAAKINEMQKAIDIYSPINDIAGYVSAVQSLDATFAPHDPSRRADMPAGYVKMLLPNEAPDVLPLRTVAERTALVEMYTSPHTETTSRAISVAFQHFIDTKYPQYTGAVMRLRDANSPIHRTHQFGQMLDLSSSMSMGVSQYSDGPVADSQFSPNYNQAFDIDMLKFMAGLHFGDQPAIKSVVSSNLEVINSVNAQLGYDFMSYDDDGEHKDHWHIVMNKAYNLPSFALRAGYLPWGANEDLWIADRALPITPEQHRSQHAPLEGWFAEQMRIVGEQQAAQAAAAAEAANTPKKQLYDAQIRLLDEIATHEGVWDSINTGVAGDTPVNSERYDQLLHGKLLTEYTIDGVVDLQDKGVRAAGRNQFMPDTLKAAIKSTGIDTNRKFDASAQNELGIYLLMDKRNSLGGFLKGEDVPVEDAVNDLCKEISSMPCMNGRGHYDGDAAGNNAAGGKERVKELIPMLEAIRNAYINLKGNK